MPRRTLTGERETAELRVITSEGTCIQRGSTRRYLSTVLRSMGPDQARRVGVMSAHLSEAL
jgi:hypothetical protein